MYHSVNINQKLAGYGLLNATPLWSDSWPDEPVGQRPTIRDALTAFDGAYMGCVLDVE